MREFSGYLFFLMLISTDSLLASSATKNCEKLLAVYQDAAKTACDNYEEQYCGENVLHLIHSVSRRAGIKALESATVHLVFHKNLIRLSPNNILKPEARWRYHVILETPQGIWDFDSREFRNYDLVPTPKDRYFADVFAKHMSNLDALAVVSIPAKAALLEAFESHNQNQPFLLADTPQGWISEPEFKKYLTSTADSHFVSIKKYSPFYYILTVEGRLKYPPRNLGDVLRK